MSLEDQPSDMLGDLGNDGISEGAETLVQPGGKPMNHSAHIGFGVPPSA